MGSKTIPKAKSVMAKGEIVKPKYLPAPDCVAFSFTAMERTQYFNLDGTCQNWTSDLFDMLKSVSGISKVDLISGNFRTYRVHSHEKAKPPSDLPDGVLLKDCYQIRISAAKGGIHGVFNENIFYIIWLDPLHNMYPNSQFGGLRAVKPPTTCCKERDAEIERLQSENAQLKEDCADLLGE